MRWGERIHLQEVTHAENVAPLVNIDPRGGFLVADEQEAQIRLYTQSGELRRYFGRRGGGPGEFDQLAAVLRLAGGAILAVDMGGALTIFNPEGTHVIETQRTPLGLIWNAVPISDDLVALSGRLSGKPFGDLVHIWNLRSKTVVRSFFPTPDHPRAFDGTYAYTGTADLAIRNDTVAVLFALEPFVYLYDLEGGSLGKLRIPYSDFRPISSPMPTRVGPEERKEWLESFSTNSRIFWVADGTLLIQYYDVKDLSPVWHLAQMGTDNRLYFDVPDSPRLLAVARQQPSLYFLDPKPLEPNVWVPAYLPSR